MLKKKPSYVSQFGEFQYYSPENLLGKQLLEKVLTDKSAFVHVKKVSGTLLKPWGEFLAQFPLHKGRLIYQHRSNHVYLWDHAAVEVSYDRKANTASASAYGLNNEACWKLLAILEHDYLCKDHKNTVYSIVQTKNGISTQVVGLGGSPLEQDNYHPEVITDFQYVVEEFKKKLPSGRIVILDGQAGTGKTHMLRSMFSELDAIFLVIPVSMLSSLDSPQFLPVLLELKENHNKPIILIIEDGDHILISRKSDNLSSLATLLNLSDGILGALIDLRIVITTNATIKEMDEAILRPGRLCKRINVPCLEYEQSNCIFKRITGDVERDLPKSKFYTLAEIYAWAHHGAAVSAQEKTPKRTIGFQIHSETDDKNLNKASH